jgi:hypothetical protein
MDPVESDSTGSFCLQPLDAPDKIEEPREFSGGRNAARMRFLVFFLALTGSVTVMANVTESDSVNGNLIRQPELRDYHQAERTPGFSPITDVINSEGRPAS